MVSISAHFLTYALLCVCSANAIVVIDGTTLNHNIAFSGAGGAVHIASQATLNVSNAHFTGNTVDRGCGGALYLGKCMLVRRGHARSHAITQRPRRWPI